MARHAHEATKSFPAVPAMHPGSHATVAVPVQDAAPVVDGDFVEVEQVAILMAASLCQTPVRLCTGSPAWR